MNKKEVMGCLRKVMDPELGVDIVSLGLIYGVKVDKERKDDRKWKVRIKMTLTSPGCPLSHVFDMMIRESLVGLPGLDVDQGVIIDLTFDPPWTQEMMSEEARVELGF